MITAVIIAVFLPMIVMHCDYNHYTIIDSELADRFPILL